MKHLYPEILKRVFSAKYFTSREIIQHLKSVSRRIYLLKLALVFVLSLITERAFSQTIESYEWKNVQIQGGGFVSGIIFNPSERNLVYARTDVGGAYRWDVDEHVWKPLLDHLNRAEENYTGVLSLATDPTNPDKVYLATGLYSQSWAGMGAILSSSDRGSTWTKMELPIKLGGNENGRSTGERLQVDPNLGSNLLLGTSADGLWKSNNSGESWSKVNSFPVANTPVGSGGISFVLFDKSSSTSGNATKTIYVGVLRTGETNLFKSTDGGATWDAVLGQITNYMPHQAALAPDGSLYVTYSDGAGPNGVTAGDVRKLSAITGEWTSLSLPSGQGGYTGISLDAKNPGTLVVSTMNRWWPNDEVFKSTDGGITWKALLNSATWDHSLAPYASASSPHWIGDVEIDPFNSNDRWFVTGYGVYNSNNITQADQNQAVRWTFQNNGLEETVPLKLISPSTGAPLVSALGDIDGFRHDNLDISPVTGRLTPRYGTNTWIDYAANQPSFMVRTFNNAQGMYGAHSTNGGTNWTAFTSAPTGTNGGGAIAVSSDGATLVWAPSGLNTLYYSTNRGTSWTAVSGISGSGLKPIADRVNARKFYVYEPEAGRVAVSTNAGVSFTGAASGLPRVASWQLGSASVNAVLGVEGDIWLTNPNGGLYHSTNSGATFTHLTNVQEATKVGFGKSRGGNTYPAVYLVGKVNNLLGFFRSDDGGSSWVRINDDQHQFAGINDITGDPRVYGRVYLATSGRGIIYGEMTDTVNGIDDDIALDKRMDLQYGPNPFSSSILLQTSHPFTYEIKTIAGVVVESGTCTKSCEVGLGLRSGMYILKTQWQDKVKSVKIIRL